MQGTHENDIRIHGMCRGTGKIYAIVDVPTQYQNSRLVVHACRADGLVVPSKLLPYKDGAYVLVLAVLDVTQTVTIGRVRDDGSFEALAKRSVHPRIARLTSQVHTALDDSRVKQIRNFDAQPTFGYFGIAFSHVLLEKTGTDYVQCSASCVYDDPKYLNGDVEVHILLRSGEELPAHECIVSRDTTTPVPSTEGCLSRALQFAFRVPHDLGEFVIWIRPKNHDAYAPSGFYAVEAYFIQWWRDMWYTWMQPATECPRYADCYQFDWQVSPSELDIQRRTVLTVRPLFSIIVPLYNTPVPYLDEMIESVLAQSYGKLELILVNASPENDKLSHRVGEWCARDKRIRLVLLSENRGITENTNEGIKAARGDFLCFLDHDDIISADALFWYAQALEEYPDTDLFYSDEDHLEEDGSHTWPFFKPDWNPDLLLGMNYVCHFLAVRKSVVDTLEPATKEFDGAQDHHMVFRVSEKARNIYHCRRVLYHWRVHPGSTASGVGEKPYAVEAGRLAVQAHLDRCGAHARAVHSPRVENRYEVEYDLEETPLVSILIPNKDAVKVLDRCLQSIREKTTYDNYEIIVIENNSESPETFVYYKEAEQVDEHVRVVYYGGDFNYPAINNYGIQEAKGDFYLFLNNDTEVITPHWLSRMVSLCSREGTGVVGAELLYPDNTIQHVGVMGSEGGPDHVARYLVENTEQDLLHLMQNVTAVTGACLLVKRSVYEEVGGMDETFEVDYNDIDFCWKVYAAGYRLVCDPSVRLYHYESLSRGYHTSKESALRFEREKGMLRLKWPEHFAFADPLLGSPNFYQHSLYRQLGR